MPTVEHAVCIYIYLFIYRFVRIHGIVNDSLYGVNLFTMPGMERVVSSKSSQVLAAASCYLLLITMNRTKLSMRQLSMRQLSISLKRFSIKLM